MGRKRRLCHPYPLRGPSQPLWSNRLQLASFSPSLGWVGTQSASSDLEGVIASHSRMGFHGLPGPIPNSTYCLGETHKPCSRCPRRRPHFLFASLELSKELAGHLLSILASPPKVQEGAPRAPGKLCDSEGWDFTKAPLLCDFLLGAGTNHINYTENDAPELLSSGRGRPASSLHSGQPGISVQASFILSIPGA